ncbi:MAG TPA: hypothetical protein VG651_08185 [Stellaceae bacterium]|nr:hypothetical protein [Stellaceae bacterium]
MSLLREIAAELCSMFMADGWLALGTLIVVAVTALLVGTWPAHPLAAGVVLLVGCLVILVTAADREAKRGAAE